MSSTYACGGIDESDLFAAADAGSSVSTDSGKTDARAKDSGTTGKDAGPVVTSGNTVQCTDGPCSLDSNQVCCESTDGTGTCDVAANCSGDKVFPIPCDDANDCAELGHSGDLCCATGDNSGNVVSVQCRAASDCRRDHGQTNLCDPSSTAPCTNGGTCTPAKSLSGYFLCEL
ncbi:MAG: hypothetical protein ABI461_00300 [Polyangiaceae bacterium]